MLPNGPNPWEDTQGNKRLSAFVRNILGTALAPSSNPYGVQPRANPYSLQGGAYQVKAEDKDFLTLSANLGMDYSTLRAANPYVQSLSQGQYINLPAAAGRPTPSPAGVVSRATGGLASPLPRFSQGPTAPAPITPNAQANAWLARVSGSSPTAPQGAGESYADYAQRAGARALNAEAALNQFMTTGTLPPDLNPNVISMLVAQGADPTKIQQAMTKGAQEAATSTDPLAGSPGHYYVDEKTAPFVGQIIKLRNGQRRRLLTDKNGRLYYAKPNASRGSYRRRAANQAEATAATAAAAAAAAAAALAAQVRGDNAVTTLNVILGS